MNVILTWVFRTIFLVCVTASQITAQKIKVDYQTACTQKKIIDSLWIQLKAGHDCATFFSKSNGEDSARVASDIALIKKVVGSGTLAKVTRTIQEWSALLPSYTEAYYFRVKGNKWMIVSLGSCCSEQIPDWRKILNLNVNEIPDQELKEFEEGRRDISMPYDESLGDLTVEFIEFDPEKYCNKN